ncbi:hypothetical protein RND71_023391 [Anisodus tanguticus]|uniref:Uncharacterized protein n=1 Tax=Anisodus tanguticus TaxID=243964 RepID=A0AAE1RTT6_9SOLA|nr:hypothetical protein RND71_023391 [Anisodus tanguticus]
MAPQDELNIYITQSGEVRHESGRCLRILELLGESFTIVDQVVPEDLKALADSFMAKVLILNGQELTLLLENSILKGLGIGSCICSLRAMEQSVKRAKA